MNDIQEMKQNAAQAAAFLKAMSHPDRLMVLCLLIESEMCASDLQQISQLGQSAFSQHLAVLRKQGFVAAERRGKQVIYRLATPEVALVLGALKQIFGCETPQSTQSEISIQEYT